MSQYLEFFGFKSEPFQKQIASKNLLKLPDMVGVKERLNYTIEHGGVMLITGEVGSGKSTSVRWALSHFHPNELTVIEVVANSASISELYKEICWGLNLDVKSASRAYLVKSFRNTVKDLVIGKKQKLLLLIDEANLLRPDIFAELHTITQFEQDSRGLFALALVGQTSLIDKLTYRNSLPLASRIISKTHLKAINHDQMLEYVNHHTKIAGIKKQLFSEDAITAVQQGSGGILRDANHLARGALIAASVEGQSLVSSEHVRIASTELMRGVL